MLRPQIRPSAHCCRSLRPLKPLHVRLERLLQPCCWLWRCGGLRGRWGPGVLGPAHLRAGRCTLPLQIKDLPCAMLVPAAMADCGARWCWVRVSNSPAKEKEVQPWDPHARCHQAPLANKKEANGDGAGRRAVRDGRAGGAGLDPAGGKQGRTRHRNCWKGPWIYIYRLISLTEYISMCSGPAGAAGRGRGPGCRSSSGGAGAEPHHQCGAPGRGQAGAQGDVGALDGGVGGWSTWSAEGPMQVQVPLVLGVGSALCSSCRPS